jgi:hypothetical protein
LKLALSMGPNRVDISILSMGPNKVGVSILSPEDENRSSFRKVVFSSYLEIWTINPVILFFTHLRQYPLDSAVTTFGNVKCL